MKAIRIFRRNVANAFKSIFRNFSLSVASITCTIITLLIVAIAVVFSANINNFTSELEKTLTIIAYVDKHATEDEINTVTGTVRTSVFTSASNIKLFHLYQKLEQLPRKTEELSA